jgi:NADH dehydrogenase
MIVRVKPVLDHVVVVGANSPTGRRLLPEMRNIAARVTALVREPTALTADRIVTDWTRNPQAVDALAQADAVILLTGVFAAPDWAAYEAATVATARQVAGALGQRRCRVVYFSYVGADADDPNWYLKSKGLAEQALAALPEAVIFRIGPIVMGGAQPSAFEHALLPRTPGASVTLFDDGHQRSRPIYAGDVVAAALAAAQGRGRAGTYDLGGPDEHSLLELVALANGREVPVQCVSLRQAASIPGLPPTVVDVMARTTPGRDVERTAALFSLELTPLSELWPLQLDAL